MGGKAISKRSPIEWLAQRFPFCVFIRCTKKNMLCYFRGSWLTATTAATETGNGWFWPTASRLQPLPFMQLNMAFCCRIGSPLPISLAVACRRFTAFIGRSRLSVYSRAQVWAVASRSLACYMYHYHKPSPLCLCYKVPGAITRAIVRFRESRVGLLLETTACVCYMNVCACSSLFQTVCLY